MLRKIDSTGDTIVEVLISLAVISFFLGGAFVTANRSLSATRQSQERGEANVLAQSQVEQLKALASSTKGPEVFATQNSFCINSNAIYLYSQSVVGAKVPLSVSTDTFDTTNGYDKDKCVLAPNGGTKYYVSITRSSTDNFFHTFKIIVRWDRAGGGSKEELVMLYRVYK